MRRSKRKIMPNKALLQPTARSSSEPSLTSPMPVVVAGQWKDHPIVIAAISVAATITLGILLVKEVILPTQTAGLVNQITTLSTEIEALKKERDSIRKAKSDSDGKIVSLEQRLANGEKKLSEKEKKLYEAQIGNLLVAGSAYPIGLAQVKIGDPIESVAAIYPDKSIKREDDDNWVVSTVHKVFPEVAYQFDSKAATKPIVGISFRMSWRTTLDDKFLQTKLVEALGTPKIGRKKNFHSWSLPGKLTVYKMSADSYLLATDGRQPMIW